MRQTTNPRRGRGRGGRRSGGSSKNQSFSSNGPNERVNGNAKTIYDKYAALAVEANRASDRVLAQTYWQHAEHYYRVMNPHQDGPAGEQPKKGRKDAAHSEAQDNHGAQDTREEKKPAQRGRRKPDRGNGKDAGESAKNAKDTEEAKAKPARKNSRAKGKDKDVAEAEEDREAVDRLVGALPKGREKKPAARAKSTKSKASESEAAAE